MPQQESTHIPFTAKTVVRDWNWWGSFLQREYYGGQSERYGWDMAAMAIASALELRPGMTVLDLGCGGGEVLFRLALRGAQCTGVEYSELLVAHNRKRAEKEHTPVTFACANMFEWEPGSTFDAILSLNTSFGYGSDEENRSLISKIGSWLSPGGVFYCDLCSADNAEEFGLWSDTAAGGRLIVNNRYDEEQRIMISDPTWVSADEETVVGCTEPERVQLYLREDMEPMMRAAGMEPTRLRQAMGRAFKQPDSSAYTTWMARKVA